FAKPIDDRLVAELFREHPFVLTLEEGSIGGFSAQVVNSLLRQGLSEHLSKLRTLHLPDRFIDHDTPAAQISQCFLCKDSIKRVVTTLLPANRRLRVASAE
ncbi:MAG TPA: 1-deoxy-D-xylulose-5-phosphate synthase, partial [Hyphomonadaceae bacterium]|nr:1-deoxy-D-xylulose-5-phosphate synthase [Hyphomonadaceae bacterium]